MRTPSALVQLVRRQPEKCCVPCYGLRLFLTLRLSKPACLARPSNARMEGHLSSTFGIPIRPNWNRLQCDVGSLSQSWRVCLTCRSGSCWPFGKGTGSATGQFPWPSTGDRRLPSERPGCRGVYRRKNLGASGIGIRYHHGDYPEDDALEGALKDAVTTAVAAGRMCSS